MARTVGRYEIRREIGRGGTAAVYLAYQTDLRRLVALKELSAFSAADPAFARRFVRESWVSASLSHPNVVTVHDYFEADGAPFIAMEYLPNGSLRSRVGALSLGQVAGALEAMLGGLAHAHAHGIVHRDLKPENVLVTADGAVKIADFGIARALDSVETALTVTGTTIGTPAYMAPEQATAGEIGPWTDLYSLGVVAFELIAGTPPFGDAEPVAILLRHVKDDPPPLTLAAPSTTRSLSDWVARLLAKAPEDRPASAAEAWDALEEIVLATLGPRWRRGAALPPERATAAGADDPLSAETVPPRLAVASRAPAGAEPPHHAADPMPAGVVPPRLASPAHAADPALAPTLPPRLPLPAAAPTRPVRRRAGWRVALALILVGWTLAALVMAGLTGMRGARAPAPPAARPAATTTGAPTDPADDGGVGDSRSDDPSDDEPDGPEP